MKVEFTIDEVEAMALAVVDELLTMKFERKDGAAIRRWRTDKLAKTSDELRRLTERVNAEVQRTHDNSRSSGIQKPDWV